MGCSRKVLIVAYHFPPEPTSGAQRTGYLAKYLPEFGWEPTVLTRRVEPPERGEARVIRTGSSYRTTIPVSHGAERRQHPAASMLKACAREIVFFPDRAAPWIPFAVAAGVVAGRRRHFDAILSSAMPASVHVAAFCLRSQLRLPWLADYRDLWTGNPYLEESRWKAALGARMERGMLRKADRITTITPPLANALEALHGRLVSAIPNAIDAEEWSNVPFERPDRFRIVHAGSLYDGRRNPERLLAQVAALRRSGELGDAALDFYGPDPGNLLDLARRHGIEDVVTYRGVVERREAMRIERAAALLVVIQNDDPRTAGEYGSKIFEYQVAGPRILVTGPSGSVLRDYVQEQDLGWFASDDEDLRAALRAAHEAYARGDYLRERRETGTARNLAQNFAAVLDEMTESQYPVWRSMPSMGREKKESAILR